MTHRVRLIAAAFALATLPAVAQAQDSQFKVGTKIVHVGLLLGSTGYTGSGGFGIGGGAEVGIAKIADVVTLGVGGELGYQRDDLGIGYGYTQNTLHIVGFVNGHYQIEAVPKLDVWGGPVIGIGRYTNDYSTTYCDLYNCSSTGPAVGVHVGARYELTSAILGSLQVSAGSRLPWINAGVAFKF